MASIKVTERDIHLLRLKSDLAYETLRGAVETPEHLLIYSAECLYNHDLGDYLSKLTQRATENFRRLNKGGRRASKIETFIIQYVLMHGTTHDGDSFKMKIPDNPEDGMGGLLAFLEARDDRSSEEGEVFRLIQKKAGELRANTRYDFILRAMQYVREKYS